MPIKGPPQGETPTFADICRHLPTKPTFADCRRPSLFVGVFPYVDLCWKLFDFILLIKRSFITHLLYQMVAITKLKDNSHKNIITKAKFNLFNFYLPPVLSCIVQKK